MIIYLICMTQFHFNGKAVGTLQETADRVPGHPTDFVNKLWQFSKNSRELKTGVSKSYPFKQF